jgi:hypothetical protein
MSSSPTTQRLAMAVQAVATGSDDDQEVGRAPFDGVVASVSYAPDTAIVGADTNTRTLELRNRGQAGSGTTVVATITTNAAGGTLAAFDEKALTLSATPANLAIVAGDILEWHSLHVGTGLADPGGLVVVEVQRTYA